MATTPAAPRRSPLSPDMTERVLSALAIALLTAVLIALGRGYAHWADVPTGVWAHIVSVIVALTLTPVILLRPRGDRSHRRLGWAWATAMMLTALLSFDIRSINAGRFSVIHVLSAWTAIQVPVIVWTARHHNVTRHRRAVRGMVIGALLIAGFFTFPFNRLMGRWLLG